MKTHTVNICRADRYGTQAQRQRSMTYYGVDPDGQPFWTAHRDSALEVPYDDADDRIKMVTPLVHSKKEVLFTTPCTISAEVGTSGREVTMTLTGDAKDDIARALDEEYPTSDGGFGNTDDIAHARAQGFVFSAAHILLGATETPLLDAVVSCYKQVMYPAGASWPGDWEAWTDWFRTHSACCPSCNAYVILTNVHDHETCGNCLRSDVVYIPEVQDYADAAQFITDCLDAVDSADDTGVLDRIREAMDSGYVKVVRAYSYSELDDKAKEKVREETRAFLDETDIAGDRIEDVIDNAGLQAGITVKDPEYSVGFVQGDHIQIMGSVDLDKFHKAQSELLAQIGKYDTDSVVTVGHVTGPKREVHAKFLRHLRVHLNPAAMDAAGFLLQKGVTMNIGIGREGVSVSIADYGEIESRDDPQEQTDDVAKADGVAHDLEGGLHELVKDLNDYLLSRAHDEVSYLNSDEYIEEMIATNQGEDRCWDRRGNTL